MAVKVDRYSWTAIWGRLNGARVCHLLMVTTGDHSLHLATVDHYLVATVVDEYQ